ncbi:MAG: hydroxyacylglutathione hydrolase [Pseudomonadota bacterium]
MLKVHQFPCLSDNYGFLAHDTTSGATVAIDVPDAEAYLAEAGKLDWPISQIWNTHWHPDHTGGNLAVKSETGCTVIGPAGEADKIPGIDQTVGGGDRVHLGALSAAVIDVPGHTLGHIAFHLAGQETAFVGDAVFALGCGRVFEGTMEMMWETMVAVKALPPETILYCAHEYTQGNARFAETIDPDNAALHAYIAEIDEKRARNEATVPALLSRELATNPFLRADEPYLQETLGHPGDAAATFGELRGRKDRF